MAGWLARWVVMDLLGQRCHVGERIASGYAGIGTASKARCNDGFHALVDQRTKRRAVVIDVGCRADGCGWSEKQRPSIIGCSGVRLYTLILFRQQAFGDRRQRYIELRFSAHDFFAQVLRTYAFSSALRRLNVPAGRFLTCPTGRMH